MSGARPDPGFMPADSNNLPKVDDCMFTLFFNSASFINPEMKNVKAPRSVILNFISFQKFYNNSCFSGKILSFSNTMVKLQDYLSTYRKFQNFLTHFMFKKHKEINIMASIFMR